MMRGMDNKESVVSGAWYAATIPGNHCDVRGLTGCDMSEERMHL